MATRVTQVEKDLMWKLYVFNDKLVLTYNYQHGTQTISLDEIESALSSDFDGATPTKARKSEEKP